MSYGFEMRFKQCDSKEEAFTIALNVTKEYFKQAKEVIQDNIYYFPTVQRGGNTGYELADEWFLVKLFSLNFIWWEDKKLLGLNNDASFLESFFDNSVYFQNSTDQNYEFSEWSDKIQFFKETKIKFQGITEDELLKIEEEHGGYIDKEAMEEDFEYYKKATLYDIIFSELNLNEWLYDKQEKGFERFTLCGIDSGEKRLKTNQMLKTILKKKL